ncbi:MAG TPA: tripartite tricarboxylate transporter substrate-binding protein [Candidatus Binatia bacterium]|nr:tripartite tricarboxylate transporter substrate-binding protein [Candidatus Binatia bacterium]
MAMKIAASFTLLVLSAINAIAQTPYYEGKSVRIIVGYPAGTTHDTWARLAGQYMSKYIPGSPAFIVQSMTGAGSMVAANYIYGIAKPDGLTLGTFNAALYFEQLIGRKEVQFDWPKMTWIGSSTPATRLFYIRADSPYATIQDLRNAADPPKCGTTGRGTTGYILPKLFEETLGLKLAVVTGYPGGGEVDLAIEKGEIQCNSTSLSVFFGREPFHSWRKKDFVRVLIQTGPKRDGRLPQVPTIYELMDQYKTPEASRRLTSVFLDAGRFGSWPIVAAPGLPTERVKILRDAFVKATSDPAFVDEANKKQLEVEPIRGEELETLAKEVVNQPPEVIERLKGLLGK